MNPMQAIASVYRRYFEFSGRSMRSEFWWFILFYIVVAVVIAVPSGAMQRDGGGPLIALYGLFILVTIIPYLAVAVRRLHDRNRTGWWMLLSFVPFGALVLIYWWALNGDDGPNKYGPPPTVA